MGIRLSRKYGVNPAVPKCFFCNRDKKEIILFGRMKDDVEAPHGKVIDKEPCAECKKWMEQGIILISVRDGEEGDNPYRTGRWVVVKDEAIKRFNPPEFVEEVLKKRIAFVPDQVWTMLGLPKGEKQ
jgi:hypothetical protein